MTAPSSPNRKAPRGWRGWPSVARICALLAVAFAAAWWFMVRMPGTSYRGAWVALTDREKTFETELRGYVTNLTALGERNADHARALVAGADYVAQRLASVGAVARLAYEDGGERFENIELALPGAARARDVVVIGAHYDTVFGTAGADDNTSGVAALLVLANRVSSHRAARTLRFVAFANEEPPYFQNNGMGSLVYARRCKSAGDNVVAMLSLEALAYFTDAPGSQKYPFPFSLAYPSTGNFVGFVGNTGSRGLVHDVVRTFRDHVQFPSEGVAAPDAIPGIGWSDQWSFWQVGYPGIMVTDTALFRNPHYHTPDDTSDKLDYPRFARVVAGLEEVIVHLADG